THGPTCYNGPAHQPARGGESCAYDAPADTPPAADKVRRLETFSVTRHHRFPAPTTDLADPAVPLLFPIGTGISAAVAATGARAGIAPRRTSATRALPPRPAPATIGPSVRTPLIGHSGGWTPRRVVGTRRTASSSSDGWRNSRLNSPARTRIQSV